MKVLSKITDEYFGKTEREEDVFTSNIKKLEFIDMGGSVLWADDDLVIKDKFPSNIVYSFNEISSIRLPIGLRLPTLEEVYELENDNIVKENSDGRILFIYVENDMYMNRLFFDASFRGRDYKMLTSTKNKNEIYFVDMCKEQLEDDYTDMDFAICRVRLVKDKK